MGVPVKLPVESLLRCKSVCKSWRSLISDPNFVKSHLNLSAHSRLIFSMGDSTILNTCCLNDVMAGNNALEVADYPLKSDSKLVMVLGACNGLLCLFIRIMKKYDGISKLSHSSILFVWNPSTRIYHKLPLDGNRSDNFQLDLFGFGYDESSDDYKVVSIFQETFYIKSAVKMYSLRNGGWKDIGAFPYGWPSCFGGKFLNGALHWAASDGPCWAIVSLNLATETFGEVVMPPVYDEYDEDEKELTLGTLGEWLCVLCDYSEGRVDLWAMKVYGVKDSWTKILSFPYMPDLTIERFLVPLCISNDGKILFTFGKKLMIYDSNNSSFSDVQNFDEDVEEEFTFFESLVSPLPPAGCSRSLT